MLFIIRAEDAPGALDQRLAIRPTHLAYLESQKSVIKVAGAMLDADGKPKGSVLVVEVEDAAAAKAFADGDPFARQGVFAKVEITAYRPALGAWIG